MDTGAREEMKWLGILILMISVNMISVNAYADTKKNDAHKFAGARLKGQLKKPEMSYIYERKGLRAERIVNVPENFNEEIIDGAGQF